MLMKKHIAILRGINVGGRRKIIMSELRDMFSSLGHSNVRSFIQSGNIIFDCKTGKSNSGLEQESTLAIKETFGHDVPVIIRSTQEIKEIIQTNPYIEQAKIEDLHLTFLKDIPENEHRLKTKEINHSPDQFLIADKHVFVACFGGYRNTKLNNSFFEKKLKVSTTTRNWKTILKLYELSQ